ncbi:MAG: hypothetical protein GY839_02470 [candidate division Zixibacteria bacterium]|nr:hypothetical protein [candidate division Zixibacteria bacterium]
MVFRLALLLFVFVLACGPRPEIQVKGDKSPQAVWDRYSARFNDVNSLAFSGSFAISKNETHEFKLQILYSSPDSFAFLAEGTLGVDLARGAIIGDSGFWEIPRENYIEHLNRDDQILFGESEIAIDIGKLLDAIFYFKSGEDLTYTGRDGSRYIYADNEGNQSRTIEINRDSATPVRQIIIDPADTVNIEYYDWNSNNDNGAFPGRIKVYSSVSKVRAEYHIKKVKVNPTIRESNFLPKL